MEQSKQTPKDELCKSALKHYKNLSEKCSDWNSLIPSNHECKVENCPYCQNEVMVEFQEQSEEDARRGQYEYEQQQQEMEEYNQEQFDGPSPYEGGP